jgi:hypothetical protein
MRRFTFLCLGTILFSAVLQAGQIYGSIILDGKGLAKASIEITCQGSVTTGVTSADGAYRIDVPQQGQCTLALTGYGRASAVVFSYANPSQYDFELVNINGTYQLRRR